MKKLLLFFLMCLPVLASADATETGGNTAPQESLYGKWRLVGWNEGGTAFEVDANYVSKKYLTIVIPREGYVMAYSMANEIIVGLLTLNGNEMIFEGERRGFSTQVYCGVMENLFFEDHICDIKSYQLDGNMLRLYYTDNDYFVFTSDTKETEDDYRPFVEEGKVWKVGAQGSGNPVQFVEYYYFDGDTIIDGRTCKKMMRQRYVSPYYSEFEAISQHASQNYVGAWYEEDKKVYFYDASTKQLGPRREMMYDFSAKDNDTLRINGQSYVVGLKQTGSMNGFKGVYREVRLYADGENIFSVPWLEGVGGTDGPTINIYPGYVDSMWFLMSCTVGDEVIYFNDKYEDGASPDVIEARKQRIDFTHTIKIKPKSRRMIEAESPLYGEYNDQQLGINLALLDEAYLVRITGETGNAFYEKTVNAGCIVGLNIDISAYPKGRYTVTVENSRETFAGGFETQTTGISEGRSKRAEERDGIYNLQGQRLNTLQKGMNIVNGKKVISRFR